MHKANYINIFQKACLTFLVLLSVFVLGYNQAYATPVEFEKPSAEEQEDAPEEQFVADYDVIISATQASITQSLFVIFSIDFSRDQHVCILPKVKQPITYLGRIFKVSLNPNAP